MEGNSYLKQNYSIQEYILQLIIWKALYSQVVTHLAAMQAKPWNLLTLMNMLIQYPIFQYQLGLIALHMEITMKRIAFGSSVAILENLKKKDESLIKLFSTISMKIGGTMDHHLPFQENFILVQKLDSEVSMVRPPLL